MLSQGARRLPALLLRVVVAVGVLWSNALAYVNFHPAPGKRLTELPEARTFGSARRDRWTVSMSVGGAGLEAEVAMARATWHGFCDRAIRSPSCRKPP